MMNSTNPNRIAEKVASRFGISVKDIGDDPVASQVLNRVMLTMSKKYAEGGSVPRQTTIAGQPHALAYINPREEQMLLDAGGSGRPGPGGIPAYEDGYITDGTNEIYVSEDMADALRRYPGYRRGRAPTQAEQSAAATAAAAGTEEDKTAADAAVKAAEEATAAQTADLVAARTTQQEKVDKLRLELSKLQTSDQDNPAIVSAISAKNQQLLGAQNDLAAIGASERADVATNQKTTAADFLKDPASSVTKQLVDKIDATTEGTSLDPEKVGDAGDATDALLEQATATTAATPASLGTETYDASTSKKQAEKALESVDAEQGDVSKTITAATADAEEMAGLGTDDIETIDDPTTVIAPPKRVLMAGEELEGSSVDMEAVNEAVQVATATANPSKKATVKGQLSELMQDFEGGEPPAWAAGAMRAANTAMAARGLGASSMAGQAIVQAAMESALPIASQDASTFAKFEAQNLSNRQQSAMFAAEQRAAFLNLDFNQDFQARVATAAKISDIANVNFTADQQIALENAKIASTADLANMSAKNAKVVADAAAMASMEMTNLNNRQQAEVQNAKNFLSMDLANLDAAQQTTLFKAKSVQDAILSDTAATNAALQFNATSENQTNQFMATLKSNTDQFNVSQSNAMAKFNTDEANALAEFNKEQENARDEFNTENGLLIAQANAKWRQGVVTSNTAAQNEANMNDAKVANAMTAKQIDNIWQEERDLMSFAWKTANSDAERKTQIMAAHINANASLEAQQLKGKWDSWGAIGAAIISYKPT